MSKQKKKPARGPLLVAIDFSQHGRPTLDYANDLARDLGTELIILHVVHDPAERPGFYLQTDKAERKWQKRLRTFVESAEEMMEAFVNEARQAHAEDAPIQKAETLLVTGTVVNRILEVATQHKASMIVMNSMGRSGAKKLLLGSKAQRVVQLSKIPVVIVKSELSGA